MNQSSIDMQNDDVKSTKSTLQGSIVILLSIAFSGHNNVSPWLPDLIMSLIRTKNFLVKRS